MATKKQWLSHFYSLQKSIEHVNFSATLDCATFIVTVSKNKNQIAQLFPQFITFRDGMKQYVNSLADDIKVFAGWRPYYCSSIPTFSDVLKYHQHLRDHGIHVPMTITSNDRLIADVVVKRRFSSFSDGILGPFKASDQYQLDTNNTEYFQRFILGNIVKIWYWNEMPVCYESQKMPQIKGDGVSTIEEILKKRTFITNTEINYRQLHDTLLYFDCDKDSIVPKNQFQIVDFRYASTLARRNAITEYDSHQFKSAVIKKQLEKIGYVSSKIVLDEQNRNFVYTVDAIEDEKGCLWVLEANANPMIHPYVYPYMINSLDTEDKFLHH